MRALTIEEAGELLASIHLKIGAWGQVCDPSERRYLTSEWMNHAAPTEALPLYCFSHQILRWLAPGNWILVQMDNSTNFSDDEDFLISRLLFGPHAHHLLVESRSFLFEFGEPDPLPEKLLVGDLLHMMLLFGAHCQIVSAASARGQHLSIQDGFVYFISENTQDLMKARELLKQLEQTPLARPDIQ